MSLRARRRAPRGQRALVLADGTVFGGRGFGATGQAVGEVCFNTAMTGYQEILTDPSYAGQIITFTFPHIGIVGTNREDIETIDAGGARPGPARRHHRALELARDRGISTPGCSSHGIPGIAGIDTRALTRRIRDGGAPNGVRRASPPTASFDLAALRAEARPGPAWTAWISPRRSPAARPIAGTRRPGRWARATAGSERRRYHVVAVDYGAKRNILRCLAAAGASVTVVPATATADEILRHKPDGVFLSNGPGDPAATGATPCRRSSS